MSIDGTDCKTWEPKHPTLSQDRRQMSSKFKHAGLKYLIAVAIHENKCVFIDGPHRGGKHDITIFRERLKQMIPEGKFVTADRGFQSSRPDEGMLAIPNNQDSSVLKSYKSRAQLRHETFNGRIKKFKILDDTFRHGKVKHKWAFIAVCVIAQYHLENGNPLYDV